MPSAEEQKPQLRALRFIGGLTLLGSAGSFLLRDWSIVGSIPFYLKLLGLSVSLFTGGVLCARALREPKGARTFLTISLLTVPLNFAALGGVLYASAQHSSWHAALLPLGLGALVLLPITYFAMLTLARARAKSLTAALFVSNLSLMVPVRDEGVVCAMLVACFAALSRLVWFSAGREVTLQTLEGRIARTALFGAPLILVARSAIYYPTSAFFWFVTATLIAVGLASTATKQATDWARHLALGLSALFGFYAAVCLGFGLDLGLAWRFAFGLVFWGVVLCALSTLFRSEARTVFAFGVGCCMLAALTLNLTWNWPGSLAALAIAIAGVTIGYSSGRLFSFTSGLLTSAITFFLLAVRTIDLGALPGWLWFSLLGAGAIVIASIIERHATTLRTRFSRLRANFSGSR